MESDCSISVCFGVAEEMIAALVNLLPLKAPVYKLALFHILL